ncbi:MAG: hypothetical protein B1H03_00425 [Planctomycetales bacterium 4484_113]|nr:MAG: hypothetical protein B1H03_00425 [Planctomycetales bacterium 4484_113]
MTDTQSLSLLAQYVPIAIYLAILVATAVAMIVLSHLLSPRRVPTAVSWDGAYECGLRSRGLPQDRYPVKYYLIAILFVVFDVETVFLFPWALTVEAFKKSGFGGYWFTEMLVFIVILLIGYAYILKKGVLQWSSGQTGKEQQ